MSKETKKKQTEKSSDAHVFTFRGDEDKSAGVSVFLAEAPNGGPAYLYYEQARAYESKQTKKTAYSRKFFSRNAESHAQAILKAKAFMDKYANDPLAALEAGKALKGQRSPAKPNGSARDEAAPAGAPF